MLKSIDLHAGGEPARVIVDGFPKIDGSTMFEKRLFIMTHRDNIRKLLLHEPRGYPCQNANIIFKSTISSSGYGYVIMEQNGIYPMMSGESEKYH
jgi:proline racemase